MMLNHFYGYGVGEYLVDIFTPLCIHACEEKPYTHIVLSIIILFYILITIFWCIS